MSEQFSGEPLKVVVVGGGGYIGFHIGVALRQRGHDVTLFDISPPDSFWLDHAQLTEVPAGIGDASAWSEGYVMYTPVKPDKHHFLRFVRGSLLEAKDLERCFVGADCVIHCASYGMSGREQQLSQWTLTEEINVKGTERVLQACQSHGVRGLVYTSTFNVVFGGHPIVNGDESLPYFPLHRHTDHYSRTKALAERLVLYSDNLGRPSSPVPLRTCALRLAGVMGLGEKRHLPRIVQYFPFVPFRYGKGSVQQFCTLPNVVQAHVKAAEQLLKQPERLGGQAYFISDVTPINTFDMVEPLRQALGYTNSLPNLPLWILWVIVYILQAMDMVLCSIHPCLALPPLLVPAEVYKSGVTHYFSSEKAMSHFGYMPENPNDLSQAIDYFVKKQQKHRHSTSSLRTTLVIMVAIVLASLITCIFIAYRN